MKKIIIVGAGGFGRELLQWCKDINSKEPTWIIKGFIDDNPDSLVGIECDYDIIGSIADWQPKHDQVFAIGIAEPSEKKKVVELLVSRGAEFVPVIHPTASIGSFSSIGAGVVLYPSSRVTVNAYIGDYVVILDQTVVGHDATIGEYSTICGSCGINGQVSIGKEVFIGSHSTIVPKMRIGNKTYIGAGSVVVSNIKDGVKVFGVPARRILL